jgi:hypothetical protein
VARNVVNGISGGQKSCQWDFWWPEMRSVGFLVARMFDTSLKRTRITQIIRNIMPFMLDASVKGTRVTEIILNIMSWGL